jgi:hypothetical protein
LSRRFQLILTLAGLCLLCLATGAFTTDAGTLALQALHFNDPSMSSGTDSGHLDPEEAVTATDSTPAVSDTGESGQTDQPKVSAAPRGIGRSGYILPEEVAHLSGDQSRTDRLAMGGQQRFGQWVRLSGEVSVGDGGAGAQLGGSYQLNDRIQLYTNSGLDTKPADSAAASLSGRLTGGAKWRPSEKATVFGEERLKSVDGQRGATHAFGLDLRPSPYWTWGTTLEMGELGDPAGGIRQQRAGGFSVGYSQKGIRYGGALELRIEEADGPARSEVWNARNDLEFQITDGWRLLNRLSTSLGSAHEDSFIEGARIEYWTELTRLRSGRDSFNLLMKYAVSPDIDRDWQTDLQLGLFGSVSEVVRVGIGYNFDHFSSGMTEPAPDGKGWFLEIAGKF